MAAPKPSAGEPSTNRITSFCAQIRRSRAHVRDALERVSRRKPDLEFKKPPWQRSSGDMRSLSAIEAFEISHL